MSASCFKLLLILSLFCKIAVRAVLLFPRRCSFGYLAAVAMPLDLGNDRNIYLAFNFESNYGLPSNDSYNELINRWQLYNNNLGIGNNVTAINGRKLEARYTRSTFYAALLGYMNHFRFDGEACLLRIICEVALDLQLYKHNGVLGDLFNILFSPSLSRAETAEDMAHFHSYEYQREWYKAEEQGKKYSDCAAYTKKCPESPLDLISEWY